MTGSFANIREIKPLQRRAFSTGVADSGGKQLIATGLMAAVLLLAVHVFLATPITAAERSAGTTLEEASSQPAFEPISCYDDCCVQPAAIRAEGSRSRLEVFQSVRDLQRDQGIWSPGTDPPPLCHG